MTDPLRAVIALIAIISFAVVAGMAFAIHKYSIMRARVVRVEAHNKQLTDKLELQHKTVVVIRNLVTQNAQAVQIMHEMIEEGIEGSTHEQAQAGG